MFGEHSYHQDRVVFDEHSYHQGRVGCLLCLTSILIIRIELCLTSILIIRVE